MKNVFKKLPFNYLKITVALVLTFWVLSLVEVFPQMQKHSAIFIIKLIGFKFLNDIWSVIICGLLFYPIYLLFNLINKKSGIVAFLIFGIILTVAQFSLVKYSMLTLVNLGADLLGYSYDDITTTVSSTESLSVMYFAPFLFFPLLFFGTQYVFGKIKNTTLFNKAFVFISLLLIVVRFFLPGINENVYQNKTYFFASDILKFKLDKYNVKSYQVSDSNEYPFLKPSAETKDVLSPFFNIQSQKPNIVILIVESLGTEFVDGNTYSGFTPYLDKLISKSLYWKNFVSTTGRTFGVLPSLLGSLPFGDTGFLELPKTPSHLSLFSILKQNGYTTSFYTGDDASFDKKINFLEYNEVDNILDLHKYGPSYVKTPPSSSGFSWGYPDSELYRKMLSTLDEKKNPRLDVLMTLSSHEPFTFPEKEIFDKKLDSMLNSTTTYKVPKSTITANKDLFSALLYTDNSLEKFMSAYAQREDYDNTIFIITGDHRIIPIEQKDKLCRFHVPLLIYSPMLKQPEQFKSISSHLDIAPSLMSFLTKNYNIESTENTSWLGRGLDTEKSFRNTHKIGLMRYKGGLKDFLYKDYLYSDGDLYKINSSFQLSKINNDALLNEIKISFDSFKQVNNYVTSQDKIYPPQEKLNLLKKVEFTDEEKLLIQKLTEEKTFDQIFVIAREQAFNEKRETARLLCDYILNELPNHVDARVLKGRTLSWEGKYDLAEKEFLESIKRFPFYDDPYSALLDLYWWSNQEEKSISLGKKALKNKIKNPEITFKLAKAYSRLEQPKVAIKIIDSLLVRYPKNQNYLKFKATLK